MTYEDNFVSQKPKIILFDQLEYIDHHIKRKIKKSLKILESSSEESVPQEFKDLVILSESIERLREVQTDENFKVALGAARTCYSSKLITPWFPSKIKLADKISTSTYKAKHHTPIQHQYHTFMMTGISRQMIWAILHQHPFYNSEQQSQRYVEMKKENVVIPKLDGISQEIFEECVEKQFKAYRKLKDELLVESVEDAFFTIYPGRKGNKEKWEDTLEKKRNEIARYVIPLATQANLYHTINEITLRRYWRAVNQPDASIESMYVIGEMVNLVLKNNPKLKDTFENPIGKEEMLEHRIRKEFFSENHSEDIQERNKEFDEDIKGKVALLVDYKPNAIKEMAEAVRDVLGLPRKKLNDKDALRILLDPQFNTRRAQTLTLSHMVSLDRARVLPSFTFMMRMSHTADSQNQRQRMSPGVRPNLEYAVGNQPDYITPKLIEVAGKETEKFYHITMREIWDARNKLIKNGVSVQLANYLLPNAVTIRYRETGDLLNFIEKDALRECLLAQREIGISTIQQREQIEEVHPELKGFFGPPCYPRAKAEKRPYCPEGDRYCGVPVFQAVLPKKQGKELPVVGIEQAMQERIL